MSIRGAPLGARVAWLSQFPYEREVVFPPGTRFQVLAPPRTDPPPPLTAPGFYLHPPYPLPAHHVAIDAPPPPPRRSLTPAGSLVGPAPSGRVLRREAVADVGS